MKHLLKYIILSIGSILVLDAVAVLGFSLYEPALKNADVIIVLGAANSSPALYYRSLQGLKLYQQGLAPVIVLSGGKGSNKKVSEAAAMQRVIQTETKKELNLVLEEDSHSTYENIKNSKAKLLQAESVILVTDKYHLARSVLLAKKYFKSVYWSSPEGESQTSTEPMKHYLREMALILVYLPKFFNLPQLSKNSHTR